MLDISLGGAQSQAFVQECHICELLISFFLSLHKLYSAMKSLR